MVTPREAEVAAENVLKDQGYDTRRAIKAKFYKVDFFGADVMGRKGISRVFVQVTTAKSSTGGVSDRRRKMERDDWNGLESAYVYQLVKTSDPVMRSREVYWFRVHRLHNETKEWTVEPKAIELRRDMFRVRR